jgi:hypothetical protein
MSRSMIMVNVREAQTAPISDEVASLPSSGKLQVD